KFCLFGFPLIAFRPDHVVRTDGTPSHLTAPGQLDRTMPAKSVLVTPFDSVALAAGHLDKERLEWFSHQILFVQFKFAFRRLGLDHAGRLQDLHERPGLRLAKLCWV